MRSPDSWLRAVGLALSAPLWAGGTRLRRLLEPAAVGTPSTGPRPAGLGATAARWDDPELARRSLRALSALSRIPAGPWRNTCLQQSVVRCRAVRATGRPAVVRIGVRPHRSGEATVEAHAWVEVGATRHAGHWESPAAEAVSGYRPLRHTRAPN
ncbi:MAG: lasso peptide biosynthesis B2 protein [Gemmatimonadales bacterium]|nr:MAG: lasso peptide biosynthesis B2 protein [Gemmatimonadales bacterium]